jgi:hypothetical protein
MEVANIFWDGELSTFEKKCIKSYVDNGFKVKLWSYDSKELDGCESCDASLVLDKSYIGKIKQYHPNISSERSNMAAFSDMFRFTLIAKNGGWWFDADCFCLKNQEDFKKLRGDKDIIAFIQEPNSINCAAFYIKQNSKVSKDILNEFELLYNDNINSVASWGTYGPVFITDFINKYDLNDCILDRDLAYAIHWEEFYLFIDSSQKEIGYDRIKNSYLTHIVNTFMNKHNVNKNEPPMGSLLHYLYQK